MNIKDMPIYKKLLVSFIGIAIISIVSGSIGLGFLIKTNKDYQYALTNYGFSQGDIGKLGIEIQKSRAIVRDIIFLANKDELIESQNLLDECEKKIHELLEVIENTSTTDSEKEIFNNLKDSSEQYDKVRKKVVKLGLENKNQEALDLFREEGKPIMEKITGLTDELLKTNISDCNNVSNKLQVLSCIAVVVIISCIIISFVLTIVLAKYISKMIGNPITDMVKIADEISQGNLDVSIESNSKDEVGALAEAFSKMVRALRAYIDDIENVLGNISNGNLNVETEVDYKGNFIEIKNSLYNILQSLNEVFGEIKEASNQVTGGSEQVSTTAQVLSEGATNQASAVEELSASMQEINEKVKSSAKNADNTNEIVIKLLEDVQKSNNEMKNMLTAMDEIEKSSNDINNIIKAIDDIAAQTNLLALNAAIEAARAGEAGKGFAVVAEEVRELANQSAQASKKTAELIQESINNVVTGKNLADNTAENLSKVVINVNKVTELVCDIASSSEEQAEAIDQVNSGVNQISDVIQSNSAISEESAAASEELTAQAETLNTMIERFKLR
ncbi:MULTISPECIES: methyl-accepting chemotaxis protein [Clostridium]|uniref:methyl-accepting chemotaxis protein n=1 Tax=Clostridium TaxID=1485 RepID=UPI000772E751|nr:MULTISPECIES: methyl-accepting chemotaxis protein [Clostridium]MBN1043134.1 methyl-accepting chemotaxis protein [Clostridium botulinum]MBY6837173.1 methyl-accepting chemotaxis protein [Clostridium botulinum]MBY6915226.1 methyl-accepting chemotaxis protein [Clostridium botulinum]MBY7025584.1 methyl-accepting chemotaxis protein [Clostridium botulinum]NFG39541.1 methyl-accepting chemotaxis protein [Clostridium botulinum]